MAVSKSTNKARGRQPKKTAKKATLNYSTLKSRQLSSKTLLIGGISLVILGILIVGLAFWYSKVYTNPERIFWDMMDNNLTTAGVTKEIIQEGGGSKTQRFTQLGFDSRSQVKIVNRVSSTTGGDLTIEAVGDLSDDYQHYKSINPVASGSVKKDYSSLYNMWIHSGGKEVGAAAHLLNDTIFSGTLFGNLKPVDRAKVINYLRQNNVYQTDFDKVQRSTNGRRTYTYTVIVNLKTYTSAALIYAQALGMSNTANLNPNNYKDTDKLRLDISVDVLSRQLTKIVYVPAGTATTEENYSGYGIPLEFKKPSNIVSSETFQKTIQDISQ